MLYGEPLIVESSLPPAVVRERIRQMVASRQMIDAPRFRRRQVLGWGFKEQPDSFTLRPEYGDAASAYGTRFEAKVEVDGSGSRVAGRVVLSRLSRVIMSTWFTCVAIAAFFALRQRADPALKVTIMAAVMVAGGVLLVRYSLRSTAALVEAGLRACLQSSAAATAAASPATQSQPNRSPTRE